MTPLDKVLALRPGNAATRLGPESRLPVLNPRDLVAALGPEVGIACFPVYSLAAVEGFLRASREEDAVIGLALPYPLADRQGPQRFVNRLREVAEEVRHRKPLFLQAGPFKALSAESRAVELLSGEVFRYVDAGFTSVSIDASALPVEDAVGVCRALAQPALERELGIEVCAAPDSAEGLLSALAADGLLVQFLRVPGSGYQLEPTPRESWGLDLGVLKSLAEVARAHGAVLSVGDESAAPDRLAKAWLESGVRKADPQETLARIALSALDPERLEALQGKSAEAGLDSRDLLAAFDPGDAADAKTKLRVEALSYGVAVDLLAAFGAAGSASRAIDALAQGGRY